MIATPEINFRRTPVTLIVAALVAALEIVCFLDPERRSYYYNDAGLGILSTLWMGRYWQPVTTALLHGNFLHAAFNVYWLITFGWALEHRFGSFRYLLLLVLLAYMSMLPQFIVSNYNRPLDQQVAVVGLSGVVYGLFGILLIGRRWHEEWKRICDRGTIQFLFFWLLLCIVLTRLGLLPVANTAHAAGLLFGVGYGLVIFDRRRRLAWSALVIPATLVVLATLIACPGHRGYQAMRTRQQMQRLLDEWNEPAGEKTNRQR